MVGLLFNDKLNMNGGRGGCQNEIGVATAMAAAFATELFGGGPEEIANAVAISLKGYEGLTCTPIGGFVAFPCISRNGLAASSALTAATLATNLFKSSISPDDVIEGYIDVADKMRPSLRETGTGGIAISKGGAELAKKLKHCQECALESNCG
jgi:L-serine dehydratase